MARSVGAAMELLRTAMDPLLARCTAAPAALLVHSESAVVQQYQHVTAGLSAKSRRNGRVTQREEADATKGWL